MRTVIVQSKTPLENTQDETILAEVSLVAFMADMTANPDPDFAQALQKRESLIITLKNKRNNVVSNLIQQASAHRGEYDDEQLPGPTPCIKGRCHKHYTWKCSLALRSVCQLLEDKQSLAGADCHVSKVVVTNRHCIPQFAVDAGKLQMGKICEQGFKNGYMYMTIGIYLRRFAEWPVKPVCIFCCCCYSWKRQVVGMGGGLLHSQNNCSHDNFPKELNALGKQDTTSNGGVLQDLCSKFMAVISTKSGCVCTHLTVPT